MKTGKETAGKTAGSQESGVRSQNGAGTKTEAGQQPVGQPKAGKPLEELLADVWTKLDEIKQQINAALDANSERECAEFERMLTAGFLIGSKWQITGKQKFYLVKSYHSRGCQMRELPDGKTCKPTATWLLEAVAAGKIKKV